MDPPGRTRCRFWEGRCAFTGLAEVELLRASHIKPWAECETDTERLDVHNGLLLAPHLDAAFDRAFLTFDDAGRVLVSPALSAASRVILGLDGQPTVRRLHDRHRAYLAWHRAHVFCPPHPPRARPADSHVAWTGSRVS